MPPETRSRAPSAAPSGMIGPALFGSGDLPPPREARKRAATLPPISSHQRAPTVPPMSGRRSPTIPPTSRTAGPPPPVELDNMVTNPPPLRRASIEAVEDDGPKSVPTHDVTSIGHRSGRSASIEERVTNERPAASLPADDASITSPNLPEPTMEGPGFSPRPGVEDAGRTEPSMSRFEMPLQAPPQSFPGIVPPPPPSSARGVPSSLAARIDARLSGDEWSTETPVVAPTPAELRALLGSPDPTRQQSLDEIERLHAASREEVPEPDFLQRRRIGMPTTEVDPDDIESAIEVAPPARRPHAVAVAKPKKSE